MAYSCRVYHKSGFNAGNQPDSPTLLNTVPYTDLAILDILQDANLSEVKVRAQWDTINDCDFCMVGSWYYAIVGIEMTSVDVAHLSLLPDYILSAGGVSALTFLDGITERVHVPSTNDAYGAFDEDDPLTAPSMPLDIDVRYHPLSVGDSDSANSFTLIETTIDLIATGQGNASITYEDDAGNAVTVPTYVPITGTTKYEYGGAHGTCAYVVGVVANDGTETLQSGVMNGVARAREIGVENAIIAQYRVPRYFAGPLEPGAQRSLSAGLKEITDDIPNFDLSYSGVNNNRVNYGEYTKYGILSTAGNRVEFKAEEIFGAGMTAPSISAIADLRSDGCPYYRFKYYLGKMVSTGDINSFFVNAVAGAQWEVVPLVYNGKSGNALDRQVYDTEQRENWNRYQENAKYNTVKSMLGYMNPRSSVEKPDKSAETSGGFNPFNYVGRLIGGTATTIADNIVELNNYLSQQRSSDLNFLVGQVASPELAFPYNSQIMRDALGNGFIVYRYKYKEADAVRIDKLLTMYGYKYTKSLEASDFTNRAKFNFVQARNVTVGGSRPEWWNNGIAAQLAGGVRFWHVLPDITAYTDGSNR